MERVAQTVAQAVPAMETVTDTVRETVRRAASDAARGRHLLGDPGAHQVCPDVGAPRQALKGGDGPQARLGRAVVGACHRLERQDDARRRSQPAAHFLAVSRQRAQGTSRLLLGLPAAPSARSNTHRGTQQPHPRLTGLPPKKNRFVRMRRNKCMVYVRSFIQKFQHWQPWSTSVLTFFL